MGQVYFVRHGQTIWNVENKICGATDIAVRRHIVVGANRILFSVYPPT